MIKDAGAAVVCNFPKRESYSIASGCSIFFRISDNGKMLMRSTGIAI